MFKRKPDLVIGNPSRPYLTRWWLIPRNRWFNVYLHKITRSDDERALHDHPWWNVSILLAGSYFEVVPGVRMLRARARDWKRDHYLNAEGRRQFDPIGAVQTVRARKAGDIVFRRADAQHRLAVNDGDTVWTLFITGPNVRRWGFACPKGWVWWQTFCDDENTGAIGSGCGEAST